MTPEMIVQLVMGLGVIPGLFIYLLIDTRKEHKERLKESFDRETKLMDHIAKSDETHRQISETLQNMERSMSKLQWDVEALKKE